MPVCVNLDKVNNCSITFANKWPLAAWVLVFDESGKSYWGQSFDLSAITCISWCPFQILSQNTWYLLFQPRMWSCFYCSLATKTESDVNRVRKEVWREIAGFALISITWNQPTHCWERQDGFYLHPVVDLAAFFRSTFPISFGQNSLMM